MNAWSSEELDRIGAAEELDLASVRRDGRVRKPVTMWVVRDGDDVYVRSVNGRGSSWRADRHEARISAGGFEKDVSLIETDEVNDEVDAVYQAKYGHRYERSVRSWKCRRPGSVHGA
jgi:hypothetical protein